MFVGVSGIEIKDSVELCNLGLIFYTFDNRLLPERGFCFLPEDWIDNRSVLVFFRCRTKL